MPRRPAKQYTKKHRKDFHWEGRDKNPFHLPDEAHPLRMRLMLGIGLTALFATFGILLYHPFFHVQEVSSSGLTRIQEAELDTAIHSILAGNKFLVVPRKNYFFLGISDLESILKDRFVLEDISIIQNFPNKLDIAVQEKISTIIYDDGEMYSYMGIDGKKVEEIRVVGESEWFEEKRIVSTTLADGTVSTTEEIVGRWHIPPVEKLQIEMGKYPIIYDKSPEVGEEYQYSIEEIETMLAFYHMLEEEYSLDATYIETRDDRSASYKTPKGGVITIDLTESIDTYKQRIDDLVYNVDIKEVWELDLRFGDRVYVR